MSNLLFPNSIAVAYEDFDLEVVPEECRRYPHLLEEIKEQVLDVATRSRGWDDMSSLQHMRAHFKLGPLYHANSLVLIRRAGKLVGLAGTVNDWHVPQGSIVHLCSLGLLPEAQRRGFLPVLLAILWGVTLQNPRCYEDFQNDRVFATAITQSPYLYALFHRLFALYPSPEREIVPEAIRQIGKAVVDRFDADLTLDEERLILRDECKFFYRRTPYSSDRKLNAFCDRALRYAQGDVFVLVGKAVSAQVAQYNRVVAGMHPQLFVVLQANLDEHGFWCKQTIVAAETGIHGERPL